jgi:hypothetical protein
MVRGARSVEDGSEARVERPGLRNEDRAKGKLPRGSEEAGGDARKCGMDLN